MSEKGPSIEEPDWRSDVDPKHLETDRLTNAHKIRQSNISGGTVISRIVEDSVFTDAYNKTLKDREKSDKKDK